MGLVIHLAIILSIAAFLVMLVQTLDVITAILIGFAIDMIILLIRTILIRDEI